MNQGKIIEFIDQGRFFLTVCLQDKGNKLHLLTPSNREVSISTKRAVLISGSVVDITRPREELTAKLREVEGERNRLKGQVNVKDLWELVRDENESFDHKYLCQLVFGETVNDDHASALVHALFEDRLYFRMKDGCFLPNTEERVHQILRQREEEALKEQMLSQGSAWLRDIRLGKSPKEPPCKADITDLLVHVSLHGTEAPDFKHTKELLARAGISNIRDTRKLLIRMGVWEEDENTDLLRLGIKTSFNQDQLEESSRLARSSPVSFQRIPGYGTTFGSRELQDLRDLPTLTIDGPFTEDFDDALSLEHHGDFLHLGVHISDVDGIILPESILDREAAERGSSLYLPDVQIPMIPQDLSQDTLSLKSGCDRRTISLLTLFDRNGELKDYQFVPGIIRVRRQLTYEESDMNLKTDATLQEFYRISRSLRENRMKQGALNLSLPELNVTFAADSSLSMKLVEQDTPSRMIVSELMILYNWLMARFCRDNQIPILFRSQPEPNEILPLEEGGHLYYVFRQRRKLSPLHIAAEPNPHSGLGLDLYTHATSPIRRYLDLVVQRQIKSFLTGTDLIFGRKELEEIRISIEPILRNLETVRRNRLRYWILKYLNQHKGERFRALVLYELKSRYRVVLTDFLIIAEIKRQNGFILKPGEEIAVEVKKSEPWEDLLDITYASRPDVVDPASRLQKVQG